MSVKKEEFTDYSDSVKLIYETLGGEMVYRSGNTIIVKLPPKRNVLTTSWLNGGYRENIEGVFNHQLNQEEINELEKISVNDFLKCTAKSIGMNHEKVTGILTAAYMDNVSIVTKYFRQIEVTAIITAGIKGNGGRAGDLASYYEENENFEFKPGTINTILIINANLSENTLLRAIMTAVEAKTVALQELMATSIYSSGIATGSGTDNISIISNTESENILTNAGKHSKLGELIGISVIEATKTALSNQCNINPNSQQDMLVRLQRFGYGEENYLENKNLLSNTLNKAEFIRNLHNFSKNPIVVAMISSILHIVDEINWGLIPEASCKKTAVSMMKTLPDVLQIIEQPNINELFDIDDSIINNWIKISVWCLLKLNK